MLWKSFVFSFLALFSHLPNLHIVIEAVWRSALKFKVCEVEHDLHVDVHDDLEYALTIEGVVIGEVGREQLPCWAGEDLTTVCRGSS